MGFATRLRARLCVRVRYAFAMRAVSADAGQRYAFHLNLLIVEFHPSVWSCAACKQPDLLRVYLLGRVIRDAIFIREENCVRWIDAVGLQLTNTFDNKDSGPILK